MRLFTRDLDLCTALERAPEIVLRLNVGDERIEVDFLQTGTLV